MDEQTRLRLREAVPANGTFWPIFADVTAIGPESILLFETAGGRPLTLASNYPYEVWLDGQFVGDGGHRCVPGQALADRWPEAAAARSVRVRVHWLDPSQEVFYRCLFDDPFFAELPSVGEWCCWLDTSAGFAAKACRQLPRQTVTLAPQVATLLPLRRGWSTRPWDVLDSPIERARYVPVGLQAAVSVRLPAMRGEPFRPEEAHNVAEYVRGEPPCELRVDTYDLGQIALHRFEVVPRLASCRADLQRGWRVCEGRWYAVPSQGATRRRRSCRSRHRRPIRDSRVQVRTCRFAGRGLAAGRPRLAARVPVALEVRGGGPARRGDRRRVPGEPRRLRRWWGD